MLAASQTNRESPSNQRRAARVLFLCFVAYSFVYTGRLNLSVASPLLQTSGILTTDQIGLLGSIFFIVYAAGRIVNGGLGDTISPTPFLTAGLALSALCNLGMSLLPPSPVLYLLWGANGFFQSMLWGAALCNVSAAYPGGTMVKRASVILSASVGVGMLIGVVLPTLLAFWGLKEIFWVPGLLLLLLSFLLWLLLPNQNSRKKASNRVHFTCLRNPMVKKMLFPAMAHGAIKENLTMWAPLLFLEFYGLDLAHATFFIFLMPLATLLGRLLFPFWYRTCKNSERATLISSFFVCALALLPFLFAKPSIWISGILLAVVSVTTSILNAELISIYPVNFQSENQVSTVSGLLDCATYIGSALGSLLFGYLISWGGYTSMIAIWTVFALLSGFLLIDKKVSPVKNG